MNGGIVRAGCPIRRLRRSLLAIAPLRRSVRLPVKAGRRGLFLLATEAAQAGRPLSLRADRRRRAFRFAFEIRRQAGRAGRSAGRPAAPQRYAIRQFSRWKDGSGLVYQGPNGFDDWNAMPAPAWTNEHGQLATKEPGASLTEAKFVLPARAAINVALSWDSKPDFVLASAWGATEFRSRRVPHRSVGRRPGHLAGDKTPRQDIASLKKIPHGKGHVRLSIYLDQRGSRCFVYSEKGKFLCRLVRHSNGPAVVSRFALINKRGDVRLELARLAEWDGPAPAARPCSTSRGFISPTARSNTADWPRTTRRQRPSPPAARRRRACRLIALTGPSGLHERHEAAGRDRRLPRFHARERHARQSGRRENLARLSRASSEPVRIWPGRFAVACGQRTRNGPAKISGGQSARRFARERRAARRLPRWLLTARDKKEASCLVWHPADSETARPLRPAASGRIIYRGTVSLESESGGLKRQARPHLLRPNVDQLLAPIVRGHTSTTN